MSLKENKPKPLSDKSSSTAIKCRVYASEGEKLIGYDLNCDDATLVRKWSLTLPASIQAGCFHPTKPFFYLALSKAVYVAAVPLEEHYLMAFKMESGSTLTRIGKIISVPHRPLHISPDKTGEHLVVTYNAPENLKIYNITPNGGLSETFKIRDLTTRKYPQHVKVSPESNLITICATTQQMNMGSSVFRAAIPVLGYKSGDLRDSLNSVFLNHNLKFSSGHLEFHPHLPLAYVSVERQNELQVYRYDQTGFHPEPIFTYTTLFGGTSKAVQLCGTVKIHPNGRYLYVLNRTLGCYEENNKKMLAKGGNDIAVFQIDPLTGGLTSLQRIDSQGIMPGTMNFDARGKLLIVANQFEVEPLEETEIKHIPQSLTVYKINTEGLLEFANKYPLQKHQKPMIWMDVLCRNL
jgi:6-phosphogluconolactonase